MYSFLYQNFSFLPELRQILEYSNFINTSAEAQKYLKTHPDFWEKYGGYKGKELPEGFEEKYYGGVNDANENRNQGSNNEDSYSLNQRQMYHNRPNLNRNQFLPQDTSQPSRHNQPDILSPQQYGEQTENVRYPAYHNVRKHGKYAGRPRQMNEWQSAGNPADWSAQDTIPYQNNMNGLQNYDVNRDYTQFAYDTPISSPDRDWNQNMYNRKWVKREVHSQEYPSGLHYTSSTGKYLFSGNSLCC